VALTLVECLKCGAARRATTFPSRAGRPDECTRCGYVGWAETESLTEAIRRALREHTLEQRRYLIAW